MSEVDVVAVADREGTAPLPEPRPGWVPVTRFQKAAFRFVACGIVVAAPYVFSSIGFFGTPRYWYERLWEPLARPLGAALRLASARLTAPPPYTDEFQLALVSCFGLAALAGAIVWSRREPPDRDYTEHMHHLRTAARYLLALATIHFGIVTILQFEFSILTPEMLVTPPAEMRSRELLWIFLGWSPLFTAFLGLVDLAAAALLLRDKTALLGALLVGGVLSNVVPLDYVFELPEKLLSVYLTLLAGVIIIPDVRRMIATHLTSDAVPASIVAPPAARLVVLPLRRVLKPGLIAASVASPLFIVATTRGTLWPPAFAPTGLYRVAAADAAQGWRWAVVDGAGGRVHVKLAGGEWRAYPAAVDAAGERLRIGQGRPSTWRQAALRERAQPVTDALATLRSSKGELRVVADDGREITLQHVDVTAHFPLMTKASRRPPDNAPPPPAAPPR